ncbi:anthranilate synthase component II [Tellurirhabdus rosea]|uniref:anthranilate synthase component II n=1 Tax=Tellurirhabdus rosea TaxID=2674997 RepID=UPI002251E2F1|nr:aminodeoxychorismate/anthranilate synthase component II [Tellurirhabdus rosea]
MKLLVLDNIDSFTYMLVDYLKQAGADCRVVRNTASLDDLTGESYDGIVLSPGPGTPRQAGSLMAVIGHYFQTVPMLGVCLGHQALGEFFGARLERADRPMHGKRSEVRQVTDDPLFAGLPATFTVTRYHSLIVNSLPAELVPLAEVIIPDSGENFRAQKAENMAFRHQKLPIYGVQFHPEAVLTDFGLEILRNWITFAKTAK